MVIMSILQGRIVTYYIICLNQSSINHYSNQPTNQPTNKLANQPTDQPASQSTAVCNYALSNPKNVNKTSLYQLESKMFVLSLTGNNYTLDYKCGQKPKF